MSDEPSVFVSVGTTSSEQQESFVRAIEDRLRTEGLSPHTLGRDTWSADAPLRVITELMDRCVGVVVVALERTYYPSGIERRGGPRETKVIEVKLPTPWNHIEAAMGHTRGLPLMVIAETGIKSEGLIDGGHEWYVQWVRPEIAALNSAEFNGVLASWKRKLLQKPKRASHPSNPSEFTIVDLIGSLKLAQLWGLLGAVAALLASAFALGAKLFSGH